MIKEWLDRPLTIWDYVFSAIVFLAVIVWGLIYNWNDVVLGIAMLNFVIGTIKSGYGGVKKGRFDILMGCILFFAWSTNINNERIVKEITANRQMFLLEKAAEIQACPVVFGLAE